MAEREYGEVKGPYLQRSIRERIEALFLDNIGKVISRDQILEVARDPNTGKEPENWHQRLSELRTDKGYTILSWRNRGDLRVSEYLMPTAERRPTAGKRLRILPATWLTVLERAGYQCQWDEAGLRCTLRDGDHDPICCRCIPKRSSVMRLASSDISHKIAFRPNVLHTAPVVPAPHMGSQTVSPSFVVMRIRGSKTFIGFCAGCPVCS